MPGPTKGGRRNICVMPGELRVDVVGTVAVWHGDRSVAGHAIGGRRARVALVAIALSAGPVPAERLAAQLWPDEPPPTWPAAVRGVIRALRGALATIGVGVRDVIVTTPAGYGLADGVQVDLRQAAVTLRAASSLADQGRHDAALAAAEPMAALSGDQLLPGEDASWLDPFRAQADAASLQALELIARSAGAAGNHHRAAEAGRRAVAASPLDERAHRILIQALHRAGDRAAAVRAYERCRAMLAEHLGVDPAPETVAVYLAALGDPGATGAGRLPQLATAFFGRTSEISALATAIGRPGLVTVVGPGGVGKSRLALQVTAPAAFPGGRLWVPVAPASRDELVASTVTMSVGLPVGLEDPAAVLAGHLAPLGRALLVLDGCEAVVDGTASLVSALLALCPALTVLVTSRVPLSVDDEQVVAVGPLPGPAGGAGLGLAASPQVSLLADRVRAAGGELALDNATTPFVTELCRRCGGLPLALELAAAQLTAMSVADLLDHLPDLIAEGADRLRAVAMSSYELLDEDEATVFRRFGVLDGPVGLPLVREVVTGGPIAPVRVIRILRELTARGMLVVDKSGPRWQYRQEDDLHRLARELLADAGETRAVTGRLAEAVSKIVPADPRAAPEPYLEPIGEVLAAVRSVLGAAVDGRQARLVGLELAFRLHRYWAASNVAEGRFWLSCLLAGESASPAFARATYALGYLSYWSGDTAAAADQLRTAVALLGDQPDQDAARALIYLGGLADDLDRGDEALEFVRRSIEAAAPFGVDLQVAAAIGMGCVLAERADPQAARYAADAIELCRSGGSQQQLAATLPTAAMVCWQVGDLAAARGYVREATPLLADSRRIARVVLRSAAAGIALADGDLDAAVDLGLAADADATDLGIDREIPLARCIVARAQLAAGDRAAAAATTLRAIEAARSLTFTYPMALCLETAALTRPAGPAQARVAGTLLAAAAAIRTRGDRPGPVTLAADLDEAVPREQPDLDAVVALAAQELGQGGAACASATGYEAK